MLICTYVPVKLHAVDSKEEAALVDVILDEVKAQRYTATEMQARTGIKSRSWQNYFRQRARPIPIKAVYAIADVLGMPGSELMRRAEERAALPESAADLTERAISQTSPEAQEALRKIRADMGHGDGDAALGEAANH